MPKIGSEPIRRAALIKATIAEIGRKGSLDVTVGQIAKAAGVSSALAHHYFGSKDNLFLTTFRAILTEFGTAARTELAHRNDPRERLNVIVEICFGRDQFEPAVIAAWLNFYVLAQTSPAAGRLLRVYQKRLVSNMRHEIKQLTPKHEGIARTTAALIDGLYLREALRDATPDAQQAIGLVKTYLDTALDEKVRRNGE